MKEIKRTSVSATFNLTVPLDLKIYNTLTSLSEKSIDNKSQIIKRALDKYFEELSAYEENQNS